MHHAPCTHVLHASLITFEWETFDPLALSRRSQTNMSSAAALSMSEFILANDELLHSLTDPISYEIMKNPVTAGDGFSYEMETLEEWIRTCETNQTPITSPMTNAPMGRDFSPNLDLRNILRDLEERRRLTQQQGSNSAGRPGSPPTGPDIVEQMSSEVFVELDRVLSLPAIKSLDLKVAQVVALGMESHGKSTLLERLVGLPLFPKDRQRCTICPIRVHLRRTESTQIAEVFIRNLKSKTELHKRSVAMDVISKAVDELMKTALTLEQGQGIASNHEIVINFSSPSMPNLDLLDLPGLVGSSYGAGSNNFAEQSYALAERVIREESSHSIFLLVVDVRAQVNHSCAAELVRVHGIETQTVGVFTKLDCFVSEDDSDDTLMRKVCGSELLTTHGWYGCISRKPALVPAMDREVDRLAAMTKSEKSLLEQPLYRDIVQLGKVGMAALRGRVLTLFEDFLCHAWIPNIVALLKTEMEQFVAKHVGECGLPIPRQNKKYDQLVSGLISEVPRSLPDCDVLRLFRIADDNSMINELNESLASFGATFGDKLDLTGDGIKEAFEAYSVMIGNGVGDGSPLSNNVRSTDALKLCMAIVDRLCDKLSSPLFLQQVTAKIQHQDEYSKGVSLAEKQFFNISRFPEVQQAVNSQLQMKLQQLQDSAREELKTSLRVFASSADGGFITPDYSAIVIPTLNQGRRGFQQRPGGTWSPAAQSMHYRIVDMWFQAVLTNLPLVLACPASLLEGKSFQETCENQRMPILKKLLDCATVSGKLLKIQADKPKLAFSTGTAKQRTITSTVPPFTFGGGATTGATAQPLGGFGAGLGQTSPLGGAARARTTTAPPAFRFGASGAATSVSGTAVGAFSNPTAVGQPGAPQFSFGAKK